ncbi:MAG: putative ABC transport system permease protein [Flavobacteriales bacterium]|jgi:putative ABC transport system permease protein
MDEKVASEVVSKDVVDALKFRKNVHPDDPRAFGFWSMAEEAEQIDTVFMGMSIVAYVFGGLVFLAGVVGIVNIMLITVKERTKEIGVRRSLGATPGNIIQQIITETLFLTVVAGLVGVVTGVGAIEGLAYALKDAEGGMFLNPGIGFNTIVIALIFMIFSGIFAGLLPALRAIAIKPVDAIRTD